MLSDLTWTNAVGGIAYLGVVATLSYAALVQQNHDALLALIAIISPATGAAAVTFLRRDNPAAIVAVESKASQA